MTNISVHIKTLFGKRESIQVDLSVTEPGSRLISHAETKCDLSQYHSFRLVYPMGQINTIDL